VTLAERWAENPPDQIKALVPELQETADTTQSLAWRFEDTGDGTRVLIECVPNPRFHGTPPVASADTEGVLCATDDGRLLRCVPRIVGTAEAPELAAEQHDGERPRVVRGFAERWSLVEFDWREAGDPWADQALRGGGPRISAEQP
jgi:hypothetical protein